MQKTELITLSAGHLDSADLTKEKRKDSQDWQAALRPTSEWTGGLAS